MSPKVFKKLSPRQDSNLGHPASRAGTLPAELRGETVVGGRLAVAGLLRSRLLLLSRLFEVPALRHPCPHQHGGASPLRVTHTETGWLGTNWLCGLSVQPASVWMLALPQHVPSGTGQWRNLLLGQEDFTTFPQSLTSSSLLSL